MSSPRVSVIVPVYNSMPHLERALESLRAQTVGDLEVICVDDGSSDDSLALLERYRADADFPALTVLTGEHGGPGCARNRGLDVATGTYVYFLDADDFIEPHTLELACGRADELGLDVVIWDFWHFNDRMGRDQHPPVGTLDFPAFSDYPGHEGRVFSAADNPDAVFSAFGNWPWNKLFRRELIEESGLRFPPLFRTEDLPFTCMALVRARRMAVIYERLSHYRIRTGTSAMDNKDRHALDFLEALALFRGQLADAGLLDAYRVAYDRWALGSVVYNLNSLRDVASFSQVFRKLRAGGLERLGLLREPEEAFDNELDRRSLDLVRAGNESAYLFFWMRNHVVFGDDAHDVFDLVESQRDGAFAERDAARADLDRAREELGRMREELARERDARERVEKDLYDVRRSAEYRYGTAMLRPARAVKNRLGKRK